MANSVIEHACSLTLRLRVESTSSFAKVHIFLKISYTRKAFLLNLEWYSPWKKKKISGTQFLEKLAPSAWLRPSFSSEWSMENLLENSAHLQSCTHCKQKLFSEKCYSVTKTKDRDGNQCQLRVMLLPVEGGGDGAKPWLAVRPQNNPRAPIAKWSRRELQTRGFCPDSTFLLLVLLYHPAWALEVLWNGDQPKMKLSERPSVQLSGEG